MGDLALRTRFSMLNKSPTIEAFHLTRFHVNWVTTKLPTEFMTLNLLKIIIFIL